MVSVARCSHKIAVFVPSSAAVAVASSGDACYTLHLPCCCCGLLTPQLATGATKCDGTPIPTHRPTLRPTSHPTPEPTRLPTHLPSPVPTHGPTPEPTCELCPSPVPTRDRGGGGGGAHVSGGAAAGLGAAGALIVAWAAFVVHRRAKLGDRGGEDWEGGRGAGAGRSGDGGGGGSGGSDGGSAAASEPFEARVTAGDIPSVQFRRTERFKAALLVSAKQAKTTKGKADLEDHLDRVSVRSKHNRRRKHLIRSIGITEGGARS